MTTGEFKKKVCDIIELYVDYAEDFYFRNMERMLILATRWGEEVFFGALEACCRSTSPASFFAGEAEKWRDVYMDSLRCKRNARNGEKTPDLPFELVFEKEEIERPMSTSVGDFLVKLADACRSGRIREMAAMYPAPW